MNDFDIMTLKSGTDVRGTAIGMPQEVTLTDEIVGKIAKGFAEFIRCKIAKPKVTIAVGHDSRLSSNRLKSCVAEALTSTGVNVVMVGLCSTPSMFMILKESDLHIDGSIMLTASHHPSDKNGMKFFLPNGGVEGSDIVEILQIADKNIFDMSLKGKIEEFDYMPIYSKLLVDKVKVSTGEEKPLEGFKIVVDAGNGAGGFYAYDVLEHLGADISGSQFLNPDGNFPNHIPNPENVEAMKAISHCVLKNKADLGVIFDTDVDRAAVVGADGQEINRNKLIGLISAILLKENAPATIVTDSITSVGLKNFINAKGGIHHRYKRGYRNVIDEAILLNEKGEYTPLAIETSGHAAFMENYFLDDGAYLVTRLIIEMAKLRKENKKLTDLISDLTQAKEADEIRLKFTAIDFSAYGNTCLDQLKIFVEQQEGLTLEPNNFEGVRINFDENNGDGWLLARMSLHDPIMAINIESNILGGNKIIAKRLYDFLSQYNRIDIGNLEKFI